MTTGRYIFRGFAQQGWRAASRALADLGVSPVKAYGRFIAGQVYQSDARAWQEYQGGVKVGQSYQSHITAGQMQ